MHIYKISQIGQETRKLQFLGSPVDAPAMVGCWCLAAAVTEASIRSKHVRADQVKTRPVRKMPPRHCHSAEFSEWLLRNHDSIIIARLSYVAMSHTCFINIYLNNTRSDTSDIAGENI